MEDAVVHNVAGDALFYVTLGYAQIHSNPV